MRQDLHKYYTALGLSPGATAPEIKRAYRQLIQRWHPDHFKPGSIMQTTAEDTTKELNEAYEQLYKKQLHKKFPPKTQGEAEEAGPAPSTTQRPRKAYRYEPPPPPEPARRENPAPDSSPQKETKKAAASRPRPNPAAFARKSGWAALRRGPWLKAVAVLGVVAAGIALWPTATPVAFLSHTNTPAAISPSAMTATDAPTLAPRPPQVTAKSAERSNPSRPATPGDKSVVSRVGALNNAPLPISSARPATATWINHDPAESVAGHGFAAARSPAFASAPRGTIPSVLAAPGMAVTAATGWGRLLDEAESLIDTFERGDNKLKVLALQGSPDEARENIFRYGSSLVYFKDGVVTGWSDGRPQLHVRPQAEVSFGLLDTFRVGSSRQEVFRAQGQPTALVRGGYYYGASAVYFEHDRVTQWIQRDQMLRTSPAESPDFEDSSRPSGR